MPSYLSSTQTSGPRRPDDLGGVLGRRGEHELERVEERQRGLVEPIVAGQLASRPDVAGQHPGPLDVVERAVEGLRDGRLDQPLAEADAEVAAEDLDDVLRGQRVGAPEEVAQDRGLARRSGRRLDRRERVGHLGQRRAAARAAVRGRRRQDVLHGQPQVGERS